jgi:ferredoxin
MVSPFFLHPSYFFGKIPEFTSMARPVWFVNLLKYFFPDRFRIARWTANPLVRSAIDRMLFEGDDIVYLPKDHTISINATINEPVSTVLPSQIVTHFIEQAGYHWIMDFCICREGESCQDYDPKLGCLFLGEAVLKINPKLGRLVSKEEALIHVERCRQAGLVHMIGRNKLDTVWLGVNPGEKLLTICNCCPCCCLWKMLPDMHPTIGDKISKMPGIQVTVTDLCAGCGICADGICFVDAIYLEDGVAQISETCRGCGRCVEVCPNQAIKLRVEDPTFLPQTIDQLASVVDVT